MKFNKLKILSIAICCAVTALWSEAQGMQRERRNDEPIRHHQAEIFPTGSVIAFAGEIAPQGWLLCDGERYHNQRYLELYQVVGMKYVNGSVHQQWVTEANERDDRIWFCVPDMRGRVIVGVDGGAGRVTANNTLGASGGTENVILTINQIPDHLHVVECSPQTQLGGQYPGDILVPQKSDGLFRNPRNTGSTGGNQPHSNMQPYTCLNYIINTGEMNNQEKLNIEKELHQTKETRQEIEHLRRELEAVKQRKIFVAAGRFLQTTSGNIDISQCFGVRNITYADNHGYMQFTINYDVNLVNPPIIVATSGITINLNGGAVGIVSSTNTSSTIVQTDARGASTTYINFQAISMG